MILPHKKIIKINQIIKKKELKTLKMRLKALKIQI